MAQLYRLLPHTGSTINTFHQPMAENFDESAGKEIQGSILKCFEGIFFYSGKLLKVNFGPFSHVNLMPLESSDAKCISQCIC